MNPDPQGAGDDLAPPEVTPDTYDEAYFLTRCGGSEQWRESGGAEIWGVYEGLIRMSGLRPGEYLVDMGTGRAELLVAAIKAGARRAVGIEYSPAAVQLAEQTLETHKLSREQAEVVLADARSVPLPDASVDLVTFCDVVEHLSDKELRLALLQARRLLRPGGRVFIHTFPNRAVYDVTYRAAWNLLGRWRGWPRNPRSEYEVTMHINEQTVGSLRHSLRDAGFQDVDVSLGAQIYDKFLPGQRTKQLLRALGRVRLLARFTRGHLFAHAVAGGR